MRMMRRLLAIVALSVTLLAGGAGVAVATPRSSVYGAVDGQAVTVVGLGDSVTSGFDSDGPDYVEQIGQALGGTANVTVRNFGVPGLTSQGLLWQLQVPTVQAALADATIVTVTIGANDVDITDIDNPDLPQILTGMGQNLTAIIGQIQSDAPNATIVVTDYWNVVLAGSVADALGSTYVGDAADLTEQVNAVIEASAVGPHVAYVDLVAPFDQVSNIDTLLASDGDHPDEAGQALIAQTILAALPAAGPSTGAGDGSAGSGNGSAGSADVG